jgi:hypothetical protein
MLFITHAVSFDLCLRFHLWYWSIIDRKLQKIHLTASSLCKTSILLPYIHIR